MSIRTIPPSKEDRDKHKSKSSGRKRKVINDGFPDFKESEGIDKHRLRVAAYCRVSTDQEEQELPV